jgi:integrase
MEGRLADGPIADTKPLIMSQKLTDTIVKNLTPPASGNRIEYDSDVKGFGCRVTANGARSFVLNYRTRAGRERRYTIGQFPAWKVAAARTEAAELKKRIDRGEDPMGDVQALRAAPTVADLCQRFKDEHLPRTRTSTSTEYEALIDSYILPEMRNLKVADVTYSDVDALHRKVSKHAPYRANRMLSVLSKMLGLAIKWGYRADNPAKGIERNQEVKRHRYLSGDELGRLSKALADHADKEAAHIIRLLLLTGARRGEVLGMRWDQLDLEAGVWTKPGSTTKQKTEHRVPLSAPARQLLAELHERAGKGAEYVFPGPGKTGHRVALKKDWADVCKAAGITEARMHDLRHTYASVLASAGLSLPVIGALLGHSQPATTARYSHLFDDPLRAATERAGAIIAGSDTPAEIIQIDRRLT